MRRQGFGIDYKLGRRTAAQHAGTSEFADRILSLPQMKTEGRSMDMFNRTALRALWACLALTLAPALACRADDERQSLEELRNTVINLLQALVDQGVISKEKAQQMVKAAQDKVAADAALAAANRSAAAKEEKEEEGAVRVPYVPQIVQDKIAKQ